METSLDEDREPGQTTASTDDGGGGRTGFTGSDALGRETIDEIESLHAAAVRAEAEQRFGLLKGRRPQQPTGAEAAELRFLARHGFASYTDFRLRIRRSTVTPAHATNPVAPCDDEQVWFAEDEPISGATGTTPGPRVVESVVDSDSPAHGADMATGSAQAERTQPPDRSESTMPRWDRPTVPSTTDVRALTEPVYAALEAETGRFIASRIDAAATREADIIERASIQAAEILAHAAIEAADLADRAIGDADAAEATAARLILHCTHLLVIADGLAAPVASIRTHLAADIDALRAAPDAHPPASLLRPTMTGGSLPTHAPAPQPETLHHT